MKYFPIFLFFLLPYSSQAQLSDIHYTNYEVVEVTTVYGFYYKLQAPIPTTTNKKQYPLQILLENHSAVAMKGATFYLTVWQDGKEKELEIPALDLATGTAKTHTFLLEAQQRPIVISGTKKNKQQ